MPQDGPMALREPDSEIIRKALMMRDAGYDVAQTFDWEALGRLLKDYDDMVEQTRSERDKELRNAPNVVEEMTKDCKRDDCRLIQGPTCMGWTPTYDRHGNRTDLGDPNHHSIQWECVTCGARWWVSTQYGVTSIIEII